MNVLTQRGGGAERQRKPAIKFISNANIMFELLNNYFDIMFANGVERWNF